MSHVDMAFRAPKVIARANIKAVKTPYPIPGDVGYYQRADVKGRVKKPKLDKDIHLLQDLYICSHVNIL